MALGIARSGRAPRCGDRRVVLLCCAYCKKPAARFQVTWANSFVARVRRTETVRPRGPWEDAVQRARPADYRLRCSRARCKSLYVLERDRVDQLLVRAARAGARRAFIPTDAVTGSRVPRTFSRRALRDESVLTLGHQRPVEDRVPGPPEEIVSSAQG